MKESESVLTHISRESKISGGILGLAVGDALGVPVEFRSREVLDLHPVTGMMGWGTHNQPPGTWSDDTSMALCILESVLEKGWDIEDQGARFLRWLTEGHLTAHGGVFDIGGTTRESLLRIRDGFRADEAGCFEENSNGNGSLMRNLPAALYLASRGDAGLAEGVSASSAITHAHSRSRLGCIIHALVSSELLAGRDAASALRGAASRLEALRRAGHLGSGMEGEISAYDRALSEGLGDLPRDKVSSSGYVVDTLEAALWCLLRSSSFEECVLSAVNLGRDTDTVGAVAGGLAGLLWGKEAIPGVWLETLVRKELILTMAEGLAGAGEEGTK